MAVLARRDEGPFGETHLARWVRICYLLVAVLPCSERENIIGASFSARRWEDLLRCSFSKEASDILRASLSEEG